MKKIFLFAACTAIAMTGCSDDDDNTIVNNDYLVGEWNETLPTANAHKIKFTNGTTAIFTDSDGTKDTLSYKIEGNKLLFNLKGSTTSKSTHDLQKVNDKTIKLGNIYIEDASIDTPAVITTFVKQ